MIPIFTPQICLWLLLSHNFVIRGYAAFLNQRHYRHVLRRIELVHVNMDLRQQKWGGLNQDSQSILPTRPFQVNTRRPADSLPSSTLRMSSLVETSPESISSPTEPKKVLFSSNKTIRSLHGVHVTSVRTGELVSLTDFLFPSLETSHPNIVSNERSMIVFATYAADFNAIEYVQRLRFYLPQLHERNITRIGLILNAEKSAAQLLVDLVDLPIYDSHDFTGVMDPDRVHSQLLPQDVDVSSKVGVEKEEGENPVGNHITPPEQSRQNLKVELFIDPSGQAGRSFGVNRGWRYAEPNDGLEPYLKLFGMLFGLGAWATLPAVISGYIGNPFFAQPWIEDALAIGQMKNRWPNTALVLEDSKETVPHRASKVVLNKFTQLPFGLGEWKRRPLELATLRLQNMLDISIKFWAELAPSSEALKEGVLTQLGGCLIVDSKNGNVLYKWRDPGICAVSNFEDILRRIPTSRNK